MLILGIESTCDETAAAVVKDGRTILSQTVASSADIHQRYGGVFPELACRRHIEAIIPVIKEALGQANIALEDLSAIAVARGPGLIGALLIGLQAAKGLAIAASLPLIGINHIEAHLYASMMEEIPPFPALGFVLSGGHTLMLKIEDLGSYRLLGSTVDDAIGEAFDKTATLLGLSYPGGPLLEQLALQGNAQTVSFSRPNVKKNPLAFSFSGLKTAALYAVKEKGAASFADIAASFQETALLDLVRKGKLALQNIPCRSLIFGGGVAQNKRLRALFQQHFDLPLFFPPPGLSSDNAAMIAGLGYHYFLQKPGGDPLDLEALPSLAFWDCPKETSRV